VTAAPRQRAERRGRRSEIVAAWALRLKGYRVVARRERTPLGEIDLVVRRGRTLAAVEVKHRPDLESALAAVPPRQRRRIAGALIHFQASRPRLAALDLRFDLVVVRPWRWPLHLPDIWRPEEDAVFADRL